MSNFWKKLKKPASTHGGSSTRGGPFFVLAPMADVTDCAFRKLIAKYGKPDVFWTEFVSADGLCSTPQKRSLFNASLTRSSVSEAPVKLLADLKFSKEEHPIVAQIFGSKPENIREAAKLCRKLGFDGIDINMGCPDKSIEKQNSGAAMMKNPKLALEIIRAAKEGAGDIPVSVKTRIGYNKLDKEWLETLLNEKLPVLTVHLRTRKEMSLVPAHWDLMPEIIKLRDKISPDTLIIGNGDALDLADAQEKVKKYKCDGVMLGRAIFGNPWLFSGGKPTIEEKLKVMVEHTKLFEKMLGKYKNFAIMKKHYKAYCNGFEGAKELRVHLMEAQNAKEIKKVVNDFLKKI